MSCTKAREFLDAGKLAITTEVDARKEKIDIMLAWKKLQDSDKVYIAKGKKIVSYPVDNEHRDDVLAAVMGPSGNLRAPTLIIGKLAIVGFNDEMYRGLIAT